MLMFPPLCQLQPAAPVHGTDEAQRQIQRSILRPALQQETTGLLQVADQLVRARAALRVTVAADRPIESRGAAIGLGSNVIPGAHPCDEGTPLELLPGLKRRLEMRRNPGLFRRIFASAAALLLAMASATAAELVVGTRTLEFTDTSRQRPVVTELWFEAAPSTAPGSFAALPPLRAMPLVTDASPAMGGGRKPLIVISHGNWATRYAYAWLAVEFVRAGYLVLSPSHPGTMFGDLRAELRARLWERSLDVTFALDHLLADPFWRDRVDMQRIGFVGHSFGGWTGVSLAGGLYRYDRQLQACHEQVKKDQYCTGLINDYSPSTPVADGTRSFKDPRFKAFYVMASGAAAGFDEASLKAIDKPMLFDTARGDAVLDPGIGSTLFAKLIPSASETVREVGHFSYAPQCKPLIGRLLAGQVCEDPAGVDRADVHVRVAADALRFFKAAL